MHNEGRFEYNKIPTVTISSYRSDPSYDQVQAALKAVGQMLCMVQELSYRINS